MNNQTWPTVFLGGVLLKITREWHQRRACSVHALQSCWVYLWPAFQLGAVWVDLSGYPSIFLQIAIYYTSLNDSISNLEGGQLQLINIKSVKCHVLDCGLVCRVCGWPFCSCFSSRIELGDVTPHNIKQLKRLNQVIFPVSYNDKFYKDVLEVGELAKLGEGDDLQTSPKKNWFNASFSRTQ